MINTTANYQTLWSKSKLNKNMFKNSAFFRFLRFWYLSFSLFSSMDQVLRWTASSSFSDSEIQTSNSTSRLSSLARGNSANNLSSIKSFTPYSTNSFFSLQYFVCKTCLTDKFKPYPLIKQISPLLLVIRKLKFYEYHWKNFGSFSSFLRNWIVITVPNDFKQFVPAESALSGLSQFTTHLLMLKFLYMVLRLL